LARGDNAAMNETDFEAARQALVTARRQAQAIASWPPERVPRDLAEAYRLQTAVARELGAIGGWKVAAVTAAQRESLAVPTPIAGPLLRPWMHDASGAEAALRGADFIAPKLECEFAFELAQDLPPRPRPYSRDEVRAATGALRIGVEIVDSRLPRGLGALAELSDAFNNGGFVAGPARRACRRGRSGSRRRRRRSGSRRRPSSAGSARSAARRRLPTASRPAPARRSAARRARTRSSR
jgi:2-keto-4-pentenoate hydratase